MSKSIIKGDMKGVCYICKRFGQTEQHHIYAKNIARAMRISAAHLAAKLSLRYFLIVCVIIFDLFRYS